MEISVIRPKFPSTGSVKDNANAHPDANRDTVCLCVCMQSYPRLQPPTSQRQCSLCLFVNYITKVVILLCLFASFDYFDIVFSHTLPSRLTLFRCLRKNLYCFLSVQVHLLSMWYLQLHIFTHTYVLKDNTFVHTHAHIHTQSSLRISPVLPLLCSLQFPSMLCL